MSRKPEQSAPVHPVQILSVESRAGRPAVFVVEYCRLRLKVSADELARPDRPSANQIWRALQNRLLNPQPVLRAPLSSKRQPKARWTKAHELCAEFAFDVDVESIVGALPSARESLQVDHSIASERNRARLAAYRSLTLHNPETFGTRCSLAKLNRLQDDGHDLQKLIRFDVIADSMANQFPSLGWNPWDCAEQLLALILEQPERVSRSREAIARRASELSARRVSVEFAEWNPAEVQTDSESVPF